VSELDERYKSSEEKNEVKSNGKRIAIISIGAGTSQLPLIRAAKEIARLVISVAGNPHAPGFRFSDAAVVKSTHHTQPVLNELERISNTYRIEGVIARTTAAQALNTAVLVSQAYGVKGLTKKLVDISTEKSALREFSVQNGIPVPPGQKINAFQADNKIDSFPVIVKPDKTYIGKNAIRICREAETFSNYVAEAVNVSGNQMAEVSHYIEGIDTSCLCWANKGMPIFITWWDELVGVRHDDKIVAIGLSIPSVIDGSKIQQKAEKIVAQLVRQFPAVDALLLVSFRITPDGKIYIIEIHSDLGGDLIADVLLPTSNPDYNFFQHAVQIASGRAKKVDSMEFKPTILFYFPDQANNEKHVSESIRDYKVFQQENVKENLKLLPDVVRSRDLNLSEWPLHLYWLNENSL